MAVPPKQRTYHHGDLKHALVETALELLALEGGFSFSLRDVAKRAGVSHAAPYKHFASKLELMAEVSAQGFDQLTQSMEAAIAPHSEPQQRLYYLGDAYIRFGLMNPALYKMMFGPDVANSCESGLKYRFSSCFQLLEATLGEAADAGLIHASEVGHLAMIAWSQVHGVTMLLQDGKIALPPEDFEALGRLATSRLLGLH